MTERLNLGDSEGEIRGIEGYPLTIHLCVFDTATEEHLMDLVARRTGEISEKDLEVYVVQTPDGEDIPIDPELFRSGAVALEIDEVPAASEMRFKFAPGGQGVMKARKA